VAALSLPRPPRAPRAPPPCPYLGRRVPRAARTGVPAHPTGPWRTRRTPGEPSADGRHRSRMTGSCRPFYRGRR